MLAWLRLLHYRLRHSGAPVFLWDRNSLDILSILAVLVALGGFVSFVAGFSWEWPAPGARPVLLAASGDGDEVAGAGQGEKCPAPAGPVPVVTEPVKAAEPPEAVAPSETAPPGTTLAEATHPETTTSPGNGQPTGEPAPSPAEAETPPQPRPVAVAAAGTPRPPTTVVDRPPGRLGQNPVAPPPGQPSGIAEQAPVTPAATAVPAPTMPPEPAETRPLGPIGDTPAELAEVIPPAHEDIPPTSPAANEPLMALLSRVLAGPLSQETTLDAWGGISASIDVDAAPYNEAQGAPLADLARQVDTALMQVLARKQLDDASIMLVSSSLRMLEDGQRYPYSRLVIDPPGFAEQNALRIRAERDSFAAALRESLRVWAPDASLRYENYGLFFIMAQNTPLHSIRYGLKGSLEPGRRPERVSPKKKAVLHIVIDDMGESLAAARHLTALPYPVTLSVWPHATHAAYTAGLAHERGRQVFIHLPLEPFRAERRAVEPGTLRVGATRKSVRRALSAAFERVPYAEGLNNHMGSYFTSDPASVTMLCEEIHLQHPRLIVLDSLTHDTSVFYDHARTQGLCAQQRTLFLDDDRSTKADILTVLDKALALARKEGRATVIGHPRPGTLAALAAWQGFRADDVVIAPLYCVPANPNRDTLPGETE